MSSPAATSSIPLPAFMASTTPLPAPAGQSGVPEVGLGLPSPPASPPLALSVSANERAFLRNNLKTRNMKGTKASKEGAAYTIRGECERLFCENMKPIFLGDEGHMASTGSIGMGANADSPDDSVDAYSYFDRRHGIDAWLEIWDYTSGCCFRGFVGGNGDKKSLFVFFDASVMGRELKRGLVALIELAEAVFAVSQFVVCIDRSVQEMERHSFMKGLRWVGFELTTLDMWAADIDTTSNEWLLMGMEI